MIVQWYPGHMAKAKRIMEKDIKLVELVIEILDARAPMSSKNPDIDRLAHQKSRLVVMNKADLADNKISEEWKRYFEMKGIKTVFLDSKNKEGLRNIMPAVREACAEKIKRNEAKGIKNQAIRAMVVGIPNVGKSTFINAFSGRNIAKAGNRPGVTTANQWVKLSKELELLDTPGLLWPKFEDQEVGKRLAFLGSINDEILPAEELAGELLLYLFDNYPNLLEARYGLTSESVNLDVDSYDYFVTRQSIMMDYIAKQRGCLKPGAVPDYFKTAGVILEDFRSGKLGKITLERP